MEEFMTDTHNVVGHISNLSTKESELENLNVAVYNEDDLEQDVAKRFEYEECKSILEACESQITTIDEKLEIVTQQIKDCETSLQKVCENGGFNGRKCRSLLNEQEKLLTKRADLVEKRTDVQKKKDKALLTLELTSNDVDASKDDSTSSDIGQNASINMPEENE